jgi:hypothetical protein
MKPAKSRTFLGAVLALAMQAEAGDLVGGLAAAFSADAGGDGSTWALVVAREPWAWHEARECARALGGELACTPDAASLGFAISLASADGAFDCAGPWVGGFRPGGGEWGWVSGQPFAAVAWAAGRPAQSTLLEAAIQLGGQGSPDGTLVDALPGPDAGGATRTALVRWTAPVDCNGNGVPDRLEIAIGSARDADADGAIDGCASAATGDLNGDGLVNGIDLGILLGAWGAAPGRAADLTQDGFVDGIDLGVLLANWTSPAP